MNNSKEISRDINIDSLAGSTMVNTSNGTVSVDSVGNHPLSREDQDDLLEASGNCIVNRNFQWPWLSTPFHNLCLIDVRGTFHFIRALEIESIGQSSNLDFTDFMEICQTLKINPKLVQRPTGDFINLLLGLDALNLLGHAVKAIPDISEV